MGKHLLRSVCGHAGEQGPVEEVRRQTGHRHPHLRGESVAGFSGEFSELRLKLVSPRVLFLAPVQMGFAGIAVGAAMVSFSRQSFRDGSFAV